MVAGNTMAAQGCPGLVSLRGAGRIATLETALSTRVSAMGERILPGTAEASIAAGDIFA